MVYLFIYFYKGAKVLQWRKVSLFNKQCWDHWEFICKKKERENFNLYLMLYIKIQMDHGSKF